MPSATVPSDRPVQPSLMGRTTGTRLLGQRGQQWRRTVVAPAPVASSLLIGQARCGAAGHSGRVRPPRRGRSCIRDPQHSTGSAGRATARSRSSGPPYVALRHAEGTAFVSLAADQPRWCPESQAFQADCAGSIPVTRSTSVSRDTREWCPATSISRLPVIRSPVSPRTPGASRSVPRSSTSGDAGSGRSRRPVVWSGRT
jgi:hypothetical protein